MAGSRRRAAPRVVLISASVVLAIATAVLSAVTAAAPTQSQPAQQTNGATELKPIRVEAPKKPPRPATTRGDRAAPAVPGDSAAQAAEQPGQGGGVGTGTGTGAGTGAAAGAAATPLNGNAVAA